MAYKRGRQKLLRALVSGRAGAAHGVAHLAAGFGVALAIEGEHSALRVGGRGRERFLAETGKTAPFAIAKKTPRST